MASGIELINRIDEILSEKGKSRKEFAKELNIQPNTMGNWKTNNSMPPADTIVQIANALEVSTDWLINGNKDFEEEEHLYRQYSRYSIRLRIYEALKKKYEKEDNRFTPDFLNNESLLRELHYYYFNGGCVSYDILYNWSKGRCEINTYFFDQWAQSLNTTLQFILTGSKVLIPTNDNYSKPFEEDLYNLALEFRNELYSLHNFSTDRQKHAKYMLNELMKIEHLEYLEKNKQSSN